MTTLVAGAVSAGAFAQGSLNVDGGLSNNPGFTTQGANATSTANATTYFTGTVSLEVFALASATQTQLNTINSFLNTTGGGAAALAAATGDGFVEVSTTTPTSGVVGAVTGSINGGSFAFAPATVGLSSAVATSTTESLLLFATIVGGADNGWSGAIAFNNSTGGNPTTTPPGTTASLLGWNTLNENLVLSAPGAVPEPTTMALAGLGSLSLFLLRRKK